MAPTHIRYHRPALAGDQCPFPKAALQDLDNEPLAGDKPFELAIFIFKRHQAPRIADLRIAVLPFPVIQSRSRDAVAADRLGWLSAGRVLPQSRDDLLVVNRSSFSGLQSTKSRRCEAQLSSSF
jgi:hypothetical protein